MRYPPAMLLVQGHPFQGALYPSKKRGRNQTTTRGTGLLFKGERLRAEA
jgi:hypothetical protein